MLYLFIDIYSLCNNIEYVRHMYFLLQFLVIKNENVMQVRNVYFMKVTHFFNTLQI